MKPPARVPAGRLRDAAAVLLLGVALTATFEAAYRLFQTVIALPRGRSPATPRIAHGIETAPATPAPPPPVVGQHAGAVAAWRYRPFVIYFAGLWFGVIGYWIYFTAQGWLALELTGSPAALSLLFTVSSFPMLALMLLGGALADRFDRHRLTFVSRLVQAAATALMGVVALSGAMNIPLFVAFGLAHGIIASVALPSRQALLGELVPPGAMGNAYAWQSVQDFLASTVGPIAAGLIVVQAGAGTALIVAGCGHLLMAAFLLGVRPLRSGSVTHESVRRRIAAGLGYVRRHQQVFLLMILATIPSLSAWGVMPLLPIVARDVLHGDARTYGWLTGAMGVGSIVGALFVALAHRIRAKGWLALTGSVLTGFSLAGLAYTERVDVALTFLLLVGAFVGIQMTLVQALVQVLTPAEYQGRVASVYMMTWNLQPIGILFFGAVAEFRGVPFAIWAAGLAMAGLTLALLIARPSLRALRA